MITVWACHLLRKKGSEIFKADNVLASKHIPLHTVSVLTHVLDTSYKVLTRALTRVQ